MEGLKAFHCLPLSTIIVIVAALIATVGAQINTPCTASMITSFTPCFNFITGSSSSSTRNSPTKECCNSFKSLVSSSMECTCLVLTANVPIPIPINRSLAISLPRVCKMSVPIQCKASGSPLPAPGPVLFAPPPPPISPSTHHKAAPPQSADSPLSPQASKAALSPLPQAPASETGLAPESDIPLDKAPASSTPGIRLNPTSSSNSNPAFIASTPPLMQLIMSVGVTVLIKALY